MKQGRRRISYPFVVNSDTQWISYSLSVSEKVVY